MIGQKYATVKRVYREGGAHQIWQVLAHKIYSRDYAVFGRLVELTGDRVRVGGCEFDVSDPQISRTFKGRLWTQLYEWEMRGVIRTALDPRLPLVELGGSIGIVSCISNRLLVHPEQHVVVEANPYLIPNLTAARARNGCKFTILQKALGYGEGNTLEFHRDPESFVSGTLVEETTDTVVVEAITLAEILKQFSIEKACVICDIEGTEIDLIDHELETLKAKVKVLIVEWHDFIVGKEPVRESTASLENAGFEQVAKQGIVSGWVNRNL